jgi:hypothetical protein
MLDAIARELQPDWTLLDVGAGAGRLAVPLAKRCRSVTCVEPSQSMGDALLKSVEAAGIRNIRLVRSTWEDASVQPHDAVLCAHVLYTVRDVATFTWKLTTHAHHKVLAVLHQVQPQLEISRAFWKRVHGEERLALPALPEFLQALHELGIPFRTVALPDVEPQSFESPQEAREVLRLRLFIGPGTTEDARLARALDELLVERNGRWHVAGLGPRHPSLVIWDGTARET